MDTCSKAISSSPGCLVCALGRLCRKLFRRVCRTSFRENTFTTANSNSEANTKMRQTDIHTSVKNKVINFKSGSEYIPGFLYWQEHVDHVDWLWISKACKLVWGILQLFVFTSIGYISSCTNSLVGIQIITGICNSNYLTCPTMDHLLLTYSLDVWDTWKRLTWACRLSGHGEHSQQTNGNTCWDSINRDPECNPR